MKFFIPIVICLLPVLTSAQSKKIKSFRVHESVTSAFVDRADDFYLVLESGEIQKYDKNGKKLASFKEKTKPSSFDPTNAIRLLTYYRERQEYTWLSPSLENSGFQKPDSSWAIEPVLICPSGDLNLWIMDAADWSLKKIDVRQSQVLTEFIFSTAIPDPDIIMMKEYLNLVFLLDSKKGIFIFNSLGRMIQKIEVSDLKYFGFLGEELYYLDKGTIRFFDLYSTEKRDLPTNKNYRFALLTDERMLTVSEQNEVVISEYKP